MAKKPATNPSSDPTGLPNSSPQTPGKNDPLAGSPMPPGFSDQDLLNYKKWAIDNNVPDDQHAQNFQRLGQWLAHQPNDVQKQVIDHLTQVTGMGINTFVSPSLFAERNQAFSQGTLLPGVDPSGNGTTLSAKDKGSILQGRQLADQGNATNQVNDVTKNPANYTYTPTLLGKTDPLSFEHLASQAPQLASNLNLDTIDQTRSDSTGVNTQKDLIAQEQALLQTNGLSDIDRARIAQTNQQNQQLARAQEAAIMADQAEKGRAGGNAQLVARLQAQQAATNREAQDNLQTSALGLQREDTIRSDIGQNAQNLQTAQDAIDKFNASGARDRQAAYNTARTQEWQDTNRRETYNVGADNLATGKTWDQNQSNALHDANAQTAARQYAASPQGGARGAAFDKLRATGQLVGVAGDVSGSQIQQGQMSDAANAQAQAGYASALGGLGSSAVNAIGSTVSGKKKDDGT